MVGVSASVNLPLHHKVQKFSSGTSSPGWSRKKRCKMVVVIVDDVIFVHNWPTGTWLIGHRLKSDSLGSEQLAKCDVSDCLVTVLKL